MAEHYFYDPENILAKIIRGELPSKCVLDGDFTLAIEDIRPQAPHHVLVMPKGPYVSYDHFLAAADTAEILDFFRTANVVTEKLNLCPDSGGGGYRLIANTGADGFQEIGHFHMHILGGRWLGPLLPSEADIEEAERVFGQKLTNEQLVNGPGHK